LPDLRPRLRAAFGALHLRCTGHHGPCTWLRFGAGRRDRWRKPRRFGSGSQRGSARQRFCRRRWFLRQLSWQGGRSTGRHGSPFRDRSHCERVRRQLGEFASRPTIGLRIWTTVRVQSAKWIRTGGVERRPAGTAMCSRYREGPVQAQVSLDRHHLSRSMPFSACSGLKTDRTPLPDHADCRGDAPAQFQPRASGTPAHRPATPRRTTQFPHSSCFQTGHRHFNRPAKALRTIPAIKTRRRWRF
jgi:hypothetical protein